MSESFQFHFHLIPQIFGPHSNSNWRFTWSLTNNLETFLFKSNIVDTVVLPKLSKGLDCSIGDFQNSGKNPPSQHMMLLLTNNLITILGKFLINLVMTQLKNLIFPKFILMLDNFIMNENNLLKLILSG